MIRWAGYALGRGPTCARSSPASTTRQSLPMSDVSTGIDDPGTPVSGASTAARPTLPKPLTSFIGREHELATARQLLQTSSLLTLTGPGGSGKTRLCIGASRAGRERIPRRGVLRSACSCCVTRAGCSPSIAQRLGLHDSHDRPLIDHLAGYLADRKLLIVLDNFEHLLDAVPIVTELLRRTRYVRILVSSRSPLRLSGEQQCPIPPLALPDQLVPASPRRWRPVNRSGCLASGRPRAVPVSPWTSTTRRS